MNTTTIKADKAIEHSSYVELHYTIAGKRYRDIENARYDWNNGQPQWKLAHWVTASDVVVVTFPASEATRIKRLRTKRASSCWAWGGDNVSMDYEINGETHHVDSSFSGCWNEDRQRFEHLHLGKNGGEVLVYAKREDCNRE